MLYIDSNLSSMPFEIVPWNKNMVVIMNSGGPLCPGKAIPKLPLKLYKIDKRQAEVNRAPKLQLN